MTRYIFYGIEGYKAMTCFADTEKDEVRIAKYEAFEKAKANVLIDSCHEYIKRNMKPAFRRLADELPCLLNGKKLVLWGAYSNNGRTCSERGIYGFDCGQFDRKTRFFCVGTYTNLHSIGF